jgi:hypothetical protein
MRAQKSKPSTPKRASLQERQAPVTTAPVTTALTTTVPGAGGLPSPNLTPEPDSQITTGVTAPGLPTHSDSPVLVTGLPQINASNTTSDIEHPPIDQESGVHNAFMTRTNHNPCQFHGSELPPPPKNAHQLENHPHKEGFILAAQKEYDSLLAKGTFNEVAIKDTNNIWVYTYKLDTDGFLDRYKARLMIRGDLTRSIYEDTYAATLIARIFRWLIAIAARFGLELFGSSTLPRQKHEHFVNQLNIVDITGLIEG